MLDPLSVAGLALAVFEQLLKIGERTTEVISDMRSFDQVSFSSCQPQNTDCLKELGLETTAREISPSDLENKVTVTAVRRICGNSTTNNRACL